MKKISRYLKEQMNNLGIGRKLALLYILCVILPLALTDGVIFVIVSSRTKTEQRTEVENICKAVEADIQITLDDVMSLTNDLYTNRIVQTFLTENYKTPMEYVAARHNFLDRVPLEMLQGGTIKNVSFYADNDTFVNGGSVYQMAEAKKEPWYRTADMGADNSYAPMSYFSFYYIGDSNPTASIKRKLSYVRGLTFYKSPMEKLVKIDIDYNAMVQKLVNMNYPYTILVCQDDVILYSNNGYSNNTQDFYRLTGKEKIACERDMLIPGGQIRVLCLKEKTSLQENIKSSIPLFLFLLATNLLLPILMGRLVYTSFVSRLLVLSAAFDKADADSLHEIKDVQGSDEISDLMKNYNYMAQRINELIKTVYTDRLEKQEMDIERQHAELLALESQINPHFLFNVLESIRMHCLLKNEKETAFMIERLASLERQNVDWVSDYATVENEIQFIEAYLDLQKYRFGDRFHFEIEMEEETRKYLIPKLTLVTFVENACVHGIEKKASDCWIYVRSYIKDDVLVLEIEDTGGGMDDELVQKMKYFMENCTLDDLKTNKHVGIINACLRLHMMTKHQVRFDVESELGVGTFTTIYIPRECASKPENANTRNQV